MKPQVGQRYLWTVLKSIMIGQRWIWKDSSYVIEITSLDGNGKQIGLNVIGNETLYTVGFVSNLNWKLLPNQDKINLKEQEKPL